MRSVLFGWALGLTVAAAAGGSVSAAPRPVYPWCAFLNVVGGITECLYYNIDQCRETVSGVGGYCYPNPGYVAPLRRPVQRSHRRHR